MNTQQLIVMAVMGIVAGWLAIARRREAAEGIHAGGLARLRRQLATAGDAAGETARDAGKKDGNGMSKQ